MTKNRTNGDSKVCTTKNYWRTDVDQVPEEDKQSCKDLSSLFFQCNVLFYLTLKYNILRRSYILKKYNIKCNRTGSPSDGSNFGTGDKGLTQRYPFAELKRIEGIYICLCYYRGESNPWIFLIYWLYTFSWILTLRTFRVLFNY